MKHIKLFEEHGIESVSQRNKAVEWWWSQTENYRKLLCDKYGFDVKQAVPKLYNVNIALTCFEKETGKKVSEL